MQLEGRLFKDGSYSFFKALIRGVANQGIWLFKGGVAIRGHAVTANFNCNHGLQNYFGQMMAETYFCHVGRSLFQPWQKPASSRNCQAWFPGHKTPTNNQPTNSKFPDTINLPLHTSLSMLALLELYHTDKFPGYTTLYSAQHKLCHGHGTRVMEGFAIR